jgi:hypothetical protein
MQNQTPSEALQSAQVELANLSADILAQDDQLTKMKERAKFLRIFIQGANTGLAAGREEQQAKGDAA